MKLEGRDQDGAGTKVNAAVRSVTVALTIIREFQGVTESGPRPKTAAHRGKLSCDLSR